MWPETEGGRGANQIASCIYSLLLKLLENPALNHIILYSDSCGGQNRNSHMSAMFLTLLENVETVSIIDHKFMVSGHSHLECDTDHSAIEAQKKKLNFDIETPYDWYKLVKTVKTKDGKKRFDVHEMKYDDFYNFAQLFVSDLKLPKTDCDGVKFKWTEIRWLRYTSSNCHRRTILFKTSLNVDEPFREFSVLKTVKENNIKPAKRTRSAVKLQKQNEVSPAFTIVHQKLNPTKCYTKSLPISI